MKQFIIYDATGKILRTGICPDSDISFQAKEGEYLIEGEASFEHNYIEDNTVVVLPEKPKGEYVFNYSTKQWVFDRETADLKAKQQRDKLLAEGPDRINPMWWSSMTEQEKQAWTFYRQALLDITGQADYPEFIVWPIKP